MSLWKQVLFCIALVYDVISDEKPVPFFLYSLNYQFAASK